MNGSDSSQKTNSKLDTFLKRNLEPLVFEQLRYNESCIVVGDRYDKVFSYVVLGHEWIYVTENPPKNVKEEVHYKDITGIELRNDLPDFLSGQDRTNSLHAVVKFRTPARRRPVKKTQSTRLSVPYTPKLHKSRSAPDVKLPERPRSASPRFARRIMHATNEWIDEDVFLESFNGEETSSVESLNSQPLSRSDFGRMSESAVHEQENVNSRSSTPRQPPWRTQVSDSESKMPPASPRLGRADEASNNATDASNSSAPSPSNIESKVSTHSKESTLHIYMLKAESPIINHLNNAWNNYLIRGTLRCDFENELKMCHQQKFPRNKFRAPPRERLASLFDQLTHEVMLPDNTMEDVFGLMNELKTATEKNSILKKFYWKYGDLFYFTVDYLKKYIPGRQCNDESEVDRSARADELELANLLLEIVSMEMRETDVFPQRSYCLRQTKGRHLADLLVLCTSRPRMPSPYNIPSRRASALLKQEESDKRRLSINHEMSQLNVEFVRLSSAVVYEVFLLAKQDTYCAGTFINISWLIKHIEEAKHTESYVEQVFTHAMTTISPSSRDRVSAKDAVNLYQQLYVLQTFLDQCPAVVTYIRTHFMEECKYYIRGPVLWSKLPDSYIITKPVITLLERIMTKVLRENVKLSVPEVTVN